MCARRLSRESLLFLTGASALGVQVTVAQPANDDCGSAVPITEGSWAFSTIDATTDGPTGCGGFSDVWFTYTASCNGVAELSTCNVTFRTRIIAYEGDPCLGPRLTCANSVGACGPDSSRVAFSVVVGRQYKVRVGALFVEDQGLGDLIVSCSSYDNCSTPVTITEGVFPFSNVGADTDGPSPCAVQGADVWARYDADFSGSIEVTTCTPGLTFDTVLASYLVPTPSDPNCPGAFFRCNDDADDACVPGGSTLRLRVEPFSQLLFQIGGHNGAQGEGELVVTPCPGDFDADGVISLADLALLLSEFGGFGCGAAGCDTDIDGDGDVDLTDLAMLLSLFGADCP